MNAPTARGAVPLPLRARTFTADRVAWVVFLASAAAVFAATHLWLHRRIPLYDVTAPPRTSTEFRLPVLVWDRVAEGPGERHTPSEVVAQQLEALRAAGFHPVTLRQVRDAYRAGAPLPERPVLLTFDGGHLTTYRSMDPVLRRMRWPGAMFLDTSAQQARHPTYVFWDAVQRMSDSGLWQFGVLGSWPESARLVERSVKGVEVTAVAGRTVTAFGGPEIATPPLAFGNALFGVNDRGANPARLVRLHVDRRWTAGTLLARIEAALAAPGRGPGGEPAPIPGDHWVTIAGRTGFADGVLTLTGDPRAEASLAGAEWTRDFTLEAEVRLEGGPFWILQQGTGGAPPWRWGGSERTLYLETLPPGQRVEILARAETTPRPGEWHALRLTKRGSGVWVEWDGAPLPGMPQRVPEQSRAQLVLSTGSLAAPGSVSFRNLRFAELPYRVREVSESPSRVEIAEVLADRSRVAALSPRGFVQEGAGFVRAPFDRELLAMLAARGAWDLCPTVQLGSDPRAADVARAAELADIAVREGWSGLRLSGRHLPTPVLGAWRTATPAWEAAFARRGLRFLVELSDV